jgi:ribosomal protein S18 acetylase RimI-like enzyme
MTDIKHLAPNEWLMLRDVRLLALQDSPQAFLATYKQENAYSMRRWQAEFARGNWTVGLVDDKPVSLLGATREPGTPTHQCYLEYLWVSPVCRRNGIARAMLTVVIERLRVAGARTVFLWVLDGNDAALHLYQGMGFVSTNHRQPLPEQPARSEERMRLELG